MNGLRLIFILAFVMGVVFWQTTSIFPRFWLGFQVNLLPSLVVYSAIGGGWVLLVCTAVAGGLCLDSFSANPLGLTVLSLLVGGILLRRFRDLMLVNDFHVQAALGFVMTGFCFGVDVIVVLVLGMRPLVSWITFGQGLVVAVVGGLATPVWFWVIPKMEKAFGYAPISQPSFRNDREIKRGKR